MNNVLNCVNHSFYEPPTYHRRFDHDLPEEAPSTAKRAALAALPFIALYKPIGYGLSLVMNGSRLFTHLLGAIEKEKISTVACADEVGKAALAATSLATTVFAFTPALFLTTAVDAAQGVARGIQHFRNNKPGLALEEALQVLASGTYLAFMATGGLEAMVAFALIQAATCLYQAVIHREEGTLEAFAKVAMAGIRLYQANQYIERIQKRNAYLVWEKTRELFLKALRGKQAFHLLQHPLSSLRERIEANEVILADGKNKEIRFGSHFHHYGKTLVKGENLTFRMKTVGGREVMELDFKVNHAFREKIEKAMEEIQCLSGKERGEVLSLTGSHAKGISVGTSSLFPGEENDFSKIGKAHQIDIEGIGRMLVGSEKDQPNLYDRVVIRLDADKTLYDLHEMLSLMDLDQALALSTAEDIDRLKMGHLFRIFFPREATPFERTEEFFSLSLEGLKGKMIEKAPAMKEVLEKFWDKIEAEEILPGRIRYRIHGLADEAYALGARALTAAITGAYNDKDLFERVASMLKMGMIATEVRHENDLDSHGYGGFGLDYLSGGADSVYTQLLTEKNCSEEMNLTDLAYHSKVRLLLSLDALELGSYQYEEDSFGKRLVDTQSWWFSSDYLKRPSILEFIQSEQNSPHHHKSHEVMLKERVAPSFFKGLIVDNEKTKAALIEQLRKGELIKKDALGRETLLNQALDSFIRVGTKVTDALIG